MSNAIPFIGANAMAQLLRDVGVRAFLRKLADEISTDLKRWPTLNKVARLAAHHDAGVVELMPVDDGRHYAFKYVNGHPGNARAGLQTVAAFGMLADMATGYPLLLAEMTLATALRTAATSALAARHMARPDSRTMAIIGNGAQSEFQALAFAEMLDVACFRLYDIDPAASAKCAGNLEREGLRATIHASAADACAGADIVTTATADKALAVVLCKRDLERANEGVHINAIGGDCPGKTECARDVLEGARIVVEYEPQTRIEGEIQRLAHNHAVTELHAVVRGLQPGRDGASETTFFDSVGFALEDFSALRLVHKLTKDRDDERGIDLVADPKNPKDLYGFALHEKLVEARHKG